MAFTNPILSGEELNRTGIKSENYSPGHIRMAHCQ